MNYLAHIYLSGDSKEISLGNFIGDHVKGRSYRDYPTDMQNGIILHRKIDSFTDTTDDINIKNSKSRLRPIYGKYSGVVIDIFYDHFLANNWSQYSEIDLDNYCAEFYDLLKKNNNRLPIKIQQIIPFLIKNKRLESYEKVSGIEDVLNIMSKYSSLPNHTAKAIECLNMHYEAFKYEFSMFFEKLIIYVRNELEILTLQKNPQL